MNVVVCGRHLINTSEVVIGNEGNMAMDLVTLLEEIQSIARTGLHYTADSYDRERYERLLALAAGQYEALLGVPAAEVVARLSREVGSITPKVGADAAIFNADGEILLQERSDGTGWCLPCGWVEANERPVDTAVRETWEETGLEVVPKELVGVFTRKASVNNGAHAMVAIVHLCEVAGGELTLSHEGLDLKYWAIDSVPHWHPNHDKYAREAFKMWRSKRLLPAVSD
jgi:8-oxo-dGTP pyrophosphatase MutT (NUDIX family)